jgi:cyclic-di-AMP phosphodiesterase PgpH
MSLPKRLPTTWFSDLIPADQAPEQPEQRIGAAWWWSVVLGAVVAAVLLPDANPFPYRYAEGANWTYNDYRSPVDIYIPIPDSVQHDVSSSGPLYFVADATLVRNQQQLLSSLVQEQAKVSKNDTQFEDLVAQTAAYSAYGQHLLSLVFEQGVVNEADWGLAQQAPRVALWSEQGSNTVSAAALFTPATALDLMTDSLPYSPLRAPELLLPILERVVVPNLRRADSVQLAISGQRNGRTIRLQKGELLVKRGQEVNDITRLKLDAVAAYLPQPVWWEQLIGNFIFALLVLGALAAGLRWGAVGNGSVVVTPFFALMVVLGILALVQVTLMGGSSVPLILPFYLLPLLLERRLGRWAGVFVWAASMLLIAFGIEWGLAWWLIQLSGVLTVLVLNQQINTWAQRIRALMIVFVVQALMWWALSLTGHLKGTLTHSDTLLFLAIAATFSLARSVLVRFFQPDLR